MKIIKKIGAGVLISLGSLFILAGIYAPFNNEIDQEEQISQAIACLVFGLPLTGGGSWIVWGLHKQSQREKSDRLQSVFYKLIKEGNGHINVLPFAMEAKISGAAARQYLDQKAQEFNADFQPRNDGNISYYFALADNPSDRISDSRYLYSTQELFNLILTECPPEYKIAVIKVIREITGLGLKEAKDFVESLPQTIKKGVSESVAKSAQQQLEAVGAKVRIILYE